METLRTMRVEGVSASKIGLALGVSKNAVVAKAKRMDLPPIGNRGSPPVPRIPRPSRGGKRMAKQPAMLRHVPPPHVPKSMPASEHKPDRCRWPMWSHASRPTHEYCAARRMSGRPYCAEHQRIGTVRRMVSE